MAKEALQQWRKERRIESFAISWPSEHIVGDDGSTITHAVLMPLRGDLDEGAKHAALTRMVEKTKAYGLVVIERRQNEIRVLFETHHGARAWITPLKRHGDLLVPGRTQVRDNAECLGFLWRPQLVS